MLVLVPVHLGTGTFGVDGTYEHQPVPKALHRYRVVTFTLVPGVTTNRCLWISLRYRLVTPTRTLRALGTGWCYQPVP